MSGQNEKNRLILIIAAVLLLTVSGIALNYFQNKKNMNPDTSILKEEISNENEMSNPLIPPEEKWLTYTSSELGFSIKYPEMVYGVYRCEPKKPFYVPLKIFEDRENEIVYITEEYYYDADYDGDLGKFTGPCEKVINTLESLNKQRIVVDFNDRISLTQNPFLTKVFVIKNIKTDTELNKFVKDNYGQGCLIENKTSWKQNKVYKIEIKGEDWDSGADLGTTTCPLNYIYEALYAPEKNKAMSINLGQDCGFGTDYNSETFKCYDEEMVNSFEFK
jgi:hypothetical protein